MGSAVLSAALLPFVDFILVRMGFFFDIHRVFNRIFLLLAIAGIAFFYSFFRSKDLFKKYVRGKARTRSFFSGTLVGGLILLVLTLGGLAMHVRILREEITPAMLVVGFFDSAGTALLVAFFETLFVWGILFVLLRDDFGKRASIYITAFIYSTAHFLKAFSFPRADGFDLAIGFRVFFSSFRTLAQLDQHGFSLIGLFLLGIFFCRLFDDSGDNIFLVAGTHAGAVFVIKMGRVLLDFDKKDYEWLFGTSEGIDGVFGWVLLLMLIAFLNSHKAKKLVNQISSSDH
ncbi:MAG: CPBP family intramembrane metalloprotease [Candidatus Aureabacteria bacterium]|nr:CPBP family intramembrane metalloprotease [Candidatus Auribacterota bacterium]